MPSHPIAQPSWQGPSLSHKCLFLVTGFEPGSQVLHLQEGVLSLRSFLFETSPLFHFQITGCRDICYSSGKITVLPPSVPSLCLAPNCLMGLEG